MRPTEMRAEIIRLHREGKMPSLEEVLAAVAEICTKYREEILAGRKTRRVKVKKTLLVIVAVLIGLVAFQITRSHLEDRRHYVTVDTVQVTGHMPNSYRASVHSPDTVYEITCEDHTDSQDGSVKPCRVLEANEVIKFETLGDLMVFFHNGNFNPWKIESERKAQEEHRK